MTRPVPAAAPSRTASPLLAALALAAAAVFALPVRPAATQETAPVVAADSLVEVRLTDGSVLIGRIVEETADRLVVVTQGGSRVELDRSQVRSVTSARGRMVGGEFWNEDPNATRLFFAPTARAVPEGEGYFSVFQLLFPFVAYGATDRITLAGGTPVIPGAIARVLYLAPKVEVIRMPQASFAVGALALFAPEAFDQGSLGVVYGVGTFGGPDRAVTLGAGFPFIASGDNSDLADQPLMMLGGEQRLTRRTKLITENYFVPGTSGAVLTGGVRFFGERLSADFGLGAATDGGSLGCCLPLVNFVYSFGGK